MGEGEKAIEENFNTSHVEVYQNNDILDDLEHEFQYISC